LVPGTGYPVRYPMYLYRTPRRQNKNDHTRRGPCFNNNDVNEVAFHLEAPHKIGQLSPVIFTNIKSP
jgi:hypothetical protein